MIWKLLCAVAAFLLVVAGFHYVAADVKPIFVLIGAFVGAYIAFKVAPGTEL